jgi:hypothetical protein
MMDDYTVNYKIRWLDRSGFSDEHALTLFDRPSYVIKIMLALNAKCHQYKRVAGKIDSGSWVKARAP